MKYKLLFSILLSISACFAQKQEIPAKIITITNDTIVANIQVDTNLFYDDIMYFGRLSKGVKYFDSANKKIKLPANQIKRMEFKDLKRKPRIFINDGNILKELVYQNIVKCLVTYTANSSQGTDNSSIDFYDENNEKVKSPPFTTSTYTLKKLVKQDPELLKLIDSSNLHFYELVKLVLKKYEDKYLVK